MTSCLGPKFLPVSILRVYYTHILWYHEQDKLNVVSLTLGKHNNCKWISWQLNSTAVYNSKKWHFSGCRSCFRHTHQKLSTFGLHLSVYIKMNNLLHSSQDIHVSKETAPFYFWNNFVKPSNILVIFGTPTSQ